MTQNHSNTDFIAYLVNQGNFDEALFLIERNYSHTENQKSDSILFYEGWANYSLKKLEQSTNSLLRVSNGSAFYHQSHFFAAYNQTYIGNYTEALTTYRNIATQKPAHEALRDFGISGIYLLKGDKQKARLSLQQMNTGFAVLSTQAQTLNLIIDEIEQYKPKNPWLAGTMSAIVPGAGKFYAGKKGEGIANFLGTVSFGAIAWENYRKLGAKNAKTIIFGSIFAATYVSNIYGAVVSVKIQETEYENAIHNQILFHLHIPLRNYFE